MYDKEGKKVADDILNAIKRSHSVEISHLYELIEQYYDKKDDLIFDKKCASIIQELISYELITENNRRYSLTKEGSIAAKVGICKYLSDYKENRDLEIKSKITAIWSNKIAIIIGFSSFVSFIGGILLSNPVKKLLNYILQSF